MENQDNRNMVSVIVPVYNCANTIAETIESVIAQTYTNWELICVDDGSTDESAFVIEQFCNKDNRIHFIKRARLPKGGSVCRNIGAFAAKGKYLIFLDGDDLLTKKCLENRLYIIEESCADFVVFPMASFKDDLSDAKKCSRTDVKNMKYYFASAQGGWQVTSPIYRTEFFKSINGFDEAFPRLQDIEFHLRAILSSGDNYIVRDDISPDCLYRMTANHYSQEKILNGLKAHRLFFKLLKDNITFLNKPNSRSIALLNNFCNIFVELYTLKTQGYDASEFDDLVNNPLTGFLRPLYKALYGVFKNIYSHRNGIIIIKIIRKLLLQKFIRFS